jgi:hypothetical protein
MKWIVLGAFLLSCHIRKPIGENDPGPDAPMGIGADAQVDSGAGSDGSSTCSCDQTSCGSRVCGRSDCGYPCGTCGPGETCLLGIGCQVISGDTPCIDAFGDRVSQFDAGGFRTCPSDPTKQQRCTCGGNGPDDWTSCDATCIEICIRSAQTIACGSSVCVAGEVCCIPNTGSDTCTTGTCPADTSTRACDGPEDCPTGSVCCGGDLAQVFTATCTPSASCTGLQQLCHTGADCPTSKPYCCPALLVDGVDGCNETNSPDCT